MHPHPTTFFDGRPHYVVNDAGCWLWQGGVTRAGYGMCSPWTGHRLAHRWYYTLYCGPLRKGLDVHHVCGVPGCVNPAHLEALTPQANHTLRRWARRPTPSAPTQPRAPLCSSEPSAEEWRAVPGYEGSYSVSDLGRVRRDAGGRGATAGHLCRPHVDPKGYHRVTLVVNAAYHGYAVHRLVAMAFLRLPQPGEQINHRNGLKSDNRPCNLEWCTGRQNMRHAVTNGLRPDQSGDRNGRAKLTRAQVQEIRGLRGTVRQVDIASHYGIAQSQVSAIQRGVTWTNLP